MRQFALMLFLTTHSLISLAEFSVLTWNVDEISDPNPQRINRLLDRALSEQPDVILFQEVEGSTWEAMTRSAPLGSRYRMAYESSRAARPRGGLVTLYRADLKVDAPRYEKLPSEMGRGQLILPIQICSAMVQLANVHLESPDVLFWRSRSYRSKQVETIKQRSENGQPWIVAGDFNPVFESDADRWFTRDWHDAWSEVHPNDPGLTWDPDQNSLAWRQGGFFLPGFRLDRLVYKARHFGALRAKVLGLGIEPPLSDHFGLRVDFSCHS